ncbi:phenylacetate--CoA ligase family protein [Candidatus Methanoliparum sp. LAM-1]|uniref:phenylacetate--CoA ligase family protein n=1 Tax=Candidatus Methanoliparum sp. LAM-1 TaxID=2874846 RepID=UPI001E44DF45|nr:phenylacetate--CoA ligase [Candidatus Methanoliparum sp. LAM-1]BDC35661.1 phenylacetate--CoA ligase [Candidatus Methanoliparum sp. LAM-1]
MEYWNPRIEKIPADELRKMQYKLLKMLVYRLYNFSPYYRRKFKKHNITPDDIKNCEDVSKLPFTYKKDLRDNYPDKMFAVPQQEIVRYHVSSGTTGKPTIVAYTQQDINLWTESLARSLTACGIGRGNIIQISYGYGLFTGGLGLHYGAERVGASVIPTGTGNTERQIELMQDMKVNSIACTPSYMIHMAEKAENLGISIKNDTNLKIAILGAEPWSEKTRQRIEDELGIDAYDIYGMSEFNGPMFTECSEKSGIHIWGDHMLVEVVDPKTGEVLEEGEEGELVVTTLQKEALPLIRYRTGDITELYQDLCECGRAHQRIARIKGRADDMLIIRGINVFPSQIEYVLMQTREVGKHFQLVVERDGALDKMTVRVEVSTEAFSDKINDMIALKNRIKDRLKHFLNINTEVELLEPGSLPRFEGKAKRIIDKREF